MDLMLGDNFFIVTHQMCFHYQRSVAIHITAKVSTI